MSRLLNTLGYFFLIVFLLAVVRSKVISGFRGGEAIGGRTAGPAATTYSPADYEGFRGESIGGRTAGPAATTYSPASLVQGFRGESIGGRTAGPAATTFTPAPLLQGFSDFQVQGKAEVGSDSGPGPASLTQPRKPYHLLSDVLQDAPRDTVGCLTAGCCNETDFEARTNLTGNYIQRTNNYKREYPDNCTGPLHDFTMAFYKTTPL